MAIVFIVTTVRNYNKEKAKNAKRAVAKPAPVPPRTPVAKPSTPPSLPNVPPVTVNTRKSQTVTQSLRSQRTLDEFEHDYSSQDAEEANAFSLATDKSAFMLEADREKEPVFDLHLNSHDDFKRAIIYSTILDRKS